MNGMMTYKEYFGSVNFDSEDEIFYGKLEFIRDLVSFQGEDAKGLKWAFKEAVDDYIELCSEQGRAPDRPFKGSFNIRPGRALHQKAALFARRKNIPLNAVVTNALSDYLKDAEEA